MSLKNMTEWQQGCETVAQRDAHILEQQLWTDCAFLVGADHTAAKEFRCHKLQLAKSSPVMAAMVYGALASEDVVRVPDTSPGAFKALLHYMYHGRLRLGDFEEACGLLYLAKKYLLPAGMVRRCRGFLWQQIRPSNVWTALQFAAANLETEMYETAQQVVRLHTTECLQEPGLLGAPLSELLRVVTCLQLSLDSELELYDGCVRWARDGVERGAEPAQTTRALQPSSTEGEGFVPTEAPSTGEGEDEGRQQESAEMVLEAALPSSLTAGEGADLSVISSQQKLREVMAPLLPNIRFLAMTPQEIADGPGGCEVLTKDETLAILLNLLQAKDGEKSPLPGSISRTSCKRPKPDENWFLVHGAPHFDKDKISVAGLVLMNSSFVSTEIVCSISTITCIGVVIPTQVKEDALEGETYEEDLTVYLVKESKDVDGVSDFSLLSTTNFQADVPFNSVVNITFSEQSVVHPNSSISVPVVFHKSGMYPVQPDPKLEQSFIKKSKFNGVENVIVWSSPAFKFVRSFAWKWQ